MHHDLPRPTSVIHDLFGDAELVTYAGPGQGVKTIAGSEWEPLIRTMPHSEFPSGSACMCKVQYKLVQRHFERVPTVSPEWGNSV